jgi:hypothetical protein
LETWLGAAFDRLEENVNARHQQPQHLGQLLAGQLLQPLA